MLRCTLTSSGRGALEVRPLDTPTPCSPESVPPAREKCQKFRRPSARLGPLVRLALVKRILGCRCVARVTKDHNRQSILGADPTQSAGHLRDRAARHRESSPSLFGALRASDGEMDRRAFQAAPLRFVCAILTERAPFSGKFWLRLHLAQNRCSSAPSVSIRAKLQSVRSPRCIASSIQTMAV